MAAASAGWRIEEADVPYLPRSGRSKVTGTVGGTVRTVRDMRKVLGVVMRRLAAQLVVIAKAPVPGRVKPVSRRRIPPHEAARLAQAALTDTLEAAASVPFARRVLALAGATTALRGPRPAGRSHAGSAATGLPSNRAARRRAR